MTFSRSTWTTSAVAWMFTGRRAMLQAMDCDLAQGYVFDRPGDAAAAEEFLARFLPVNVAA